MSRSNSVCAYDILCLMDYAYLQAKKNGRIVKLADLDKKFGWKPNEVHEAMASETGKELFKEYIGADGIYYQMNYKYVNYEVDKMHDYIRFLCSIK